MARKGAKACALSSRRETVRRKGARGKNQGFDDVDLMIRRCVSEPWDQTLRPNVTVKGLHARPFGSVPAVFIWQPSTENRLGPRPALHLTGDMEMCPGDLELWSMPF